MTRTQLSLVLASTITADGSSDDSDPHGSRRSHGRTLKDDSRAISSCLKQSYQTKQLRMRLTAANVVYQIKF